MENELSSLLTTIVRNKTLHAKWLNTLSYLENCGARKIAACEHPTLVKEEMLKHASEEFRHSHYLKKQIKKVSSDVFPNYSSAFIIGGFTSLHYLNKLDIFTLKFLKKQQTLSKFEIKRYAYFLVTYAIELRARSLYPAYENILRAHKSKVFVKSIILEEEGHLEEMEKNLSNLNFGLKYSNIINNIENKIFNKWIKVIKNESFLL